MRRVNKQTKKTAKSPALLGRRLRSLRNSRKLTLDQLSTMAGVSKAMLSQIEQDKVNPTVAVMLKIAGALKITINDLLDMPRPHNILRVIEAGDETYDFFSDNQVSIRTLSPLNLEKTTEFYRLTIESGAEHGREAHFPGTEEIVYLAKGKLQVTSGDQSKTISKGDSIHYRGDLPHVLRNISKGQSEVYMVVRYREE